MHRSSFGPVRREKSRCECKPSATVRRHTRNDYGGDHVGADAGNDRQHVAVTDVKGESRSARPDQRAECDAGIENANNSAD